MVEHPVYAQLAFMLDRVPALIAARPELKAREPFKTALSGKIVSIEEDADPGTDAVYIGTVLSPVRTRPGPIYRRILDKNRQESSR